MHCGLTELNIKNIFAAKDAKGANKNFKALFFFRVFLRPSRQKESFKFYTSKSMEIIYLLLPVALIIVIIIIAVFFWAVKSDQFEDLEGPAYRILMDDDDKNNKTKKDSSSSNDKPD
jgi:cbb3-type cytochrome oxidase maturation protein